jgi:hypothetical protein
LAPILEDRLYAGFPTKEALFTAAVGMRNAARIVGRFESQVPAGATLEERLVSAGTSILQRLLVSEEIDFMRLSIAKAPVSGIGRRWPDSARARGTRRDSGMTPGSRSWCGTLGWYPPPYLERWYATVVFA